MLGHVLQRVRQHELERVVLLRSVVHADDPVEPRAVITHSRAAGTAEEVEEGHRGNLPALPSRTPS
jgi:hypothetical protein